MVFTEKQYILQQNKHLGLTLNWSVPASAILLQPILRKPHTIESEVDDQENELRKGHVITPLSSKVLVHKENDLLSPIFTNLTNQTINDSNPKNMKWCRRKRENTPTKAFSKRPKTCLPVPKQSNTKGDDEGTALETHIRPRSQDKSVLLYIQELEHELAEKTKQLYIASQQLACEKNVIHKMYESFSCLKTSLDEVVHDYSLKRGSRIYATGIGTLDTTTSWRGKCIKDDGTRGQVPQACGTPSLGIIIYFLKAHLLSDRLLLNSSYNSWPVFHPVLLAYVDTIMLRIILRHSCNTLYFQPSILRIKADMFNVVVIPGPLLKLLLVSFKTSTSPFLMIESRPSYSSSPQSSHNGHALVVRKELFSKTHLCSILKFQLDMVKQQLMYLKQDQRNWDISIQTNLRSLKTRLGSLQTNDALCSTKPTATAQQENDRTTFKTHSRTASGIKSRGTLQRHLNTLSRTLQRRTIRLQQRK
ncbi:hypothetical protein SJAG_04769 [Schizosaccharomyces japonicus yFS275]|uniref:Uncharacterized protein n=1 Tax=Schizosaccharomyces japonicus (strain yFS275 / FY16936) TaxID=402676 RepID=B6K7Q3_SCHJY|nr:hypothetical protein SJAG_04769 [Schizosaccharomyces japonicus yFS275]EEB09557.1 hypothetical protein SJAG_04769 [Schizosaccharomyces japonicus yFS275]